MSSSVKLAIALGIATIVAMGSWYLIAQPDDSATGDTETGAGPASGALNRSYGILRKQSEEAPPRVEASIRRALNDPSQTFRLESSHLAHTSRGDIWVVAGVVAGKSLSCLIQAGSGAISCASTAEAIRNGMALGAVEAASDPGRPPRGFLVLGIAPDWARATQLKAGVGEDATTRLVAVRHNTYALRSRAPILVEGLCARAAGGCRRLHPVETPTG